VRMGVRHLDDQKCLRKRPIEKEEGRWEKKANKPQKENSDPKRRCWISTKITQK